MYPASLIQFSHFSETNSSQMAASKCVERAQSLILINTISGHCHCQGVNSTRQACTVQACDEQAWLGRLGWTLPGLVPPCRWPRFHSCGLESPTRQQHQHQHAVDSKRPVPGGPYSLLHLSTTPGTLKFIRSHGFKQQQLTTAWPFRPDLNRNIPPACPSQLM